MFIHIWENPEDPYAGVRLLKNAYKDEDQRWVFEYFWEGEQHPNPLVDWVYKHFRQCKYGRTTDEQTLRITEDGNLQSHNWGGDQHYRKWLVKHFSGTFPITNDMDVNIYISTWNHCFSTVPVGEAKNYSLKTTFFFDPLTGLCQEYN